MSELRKALTSTGDGAALVPYDLEPALAEELLRLQPLAQLIPVKQAEGKTHEYNVRSSHPAAWFEGEVTSGTAGNGVYARKSVALKIQRIWGSVTGFSKAVTAKFLDNLDEELNGSLMGMGDLMEFGALYGVSNDVGWTGDAYQYTGILPKLYYDAPENVIDGGGDKITLDDLDSVLAVAAKHRQTRNDPGAWFMGLRMKQVVDGLQSKVQLPLRSVTLADGKLVMAAYADRPILESDMVVPAASTSSPATTATKAAGGSLADATYTYKISSVTMNGEQVAGTASAGITTETTNNSVDLTWTADPAAKSYMIWRDVGGGGYQLLDIIPAKTYDANGLVNGSVESYSDEGTRTPKAIEPLAAGEQMVVFANLHPDRGAAWMTIRDDMGQAVSAEGVPSGLINFVELARTKDTFDYMLKSYLALRTKHINLFGALRHVKVA